ncbi:MAG: toxin-antitoxin system YwqK family antitoxin, partial [Bacteroidota bacterium]|nr:toxin-antitoxin system YwqK family antitoxin [Bacteroidota bacterium]
MERRKERDGWRIVFIGCRSKFLLRKQYPSINIISQIFSSLGNTNPSMKKLSLLCIVIIVVFGVSSFIDIEPELQKITETPAKEYTRSYSVLKNNPDTLHGKFTETYKGVEITSGAYVNHLPDGQWIFRGLNNRIQRSLKFKKGELNGLCLRFYPTGDTLSISFYRMGNIDGIRKSFHSNGKLRLFETFEDGKPVGKFTYWYDNGQIESFRTYTNYKRNGEYKYFSETGILTEEGTYKEGRLNGVVKEYYPDGKLRLEIEYKDGKKWNLVNQSKKNGKENKKSGTLVNGNGTFNLYNDNGVRVKTETFSNGLLEGKRTIYYPNGKPESVAE